MANLLNIPAAAHYYSKFANQELFWLPMDTQELWIKNQQDPVCRQRLAKNGWLSMVDFTYRFNQHGFRCEEFDDQPCVLCLGCSFTMGIGLPVQMTWPHVLQERMGVRCWNLGLGGCSADTCFRILNHYIDLCKVITVVCLLPAEDRMELRIDSQYISMNPHDRDHYPIYRHYAAESDNMRINREKNLLAMRQLCQQRSIPFFWASSDQIMMQPCPRSLARDLAHSGAVEHTRCAEIFHKQIMPTTA